MIASPLLVSTYFEFNSLTVFSVLTKNVQPILSRISLTQYHGKNRNKQGAVQKEIAMVLTTLCF